MSPTIIALITVGLCLVLILVEMPVALSIGIAGMSGVVLLGGADMAASSLGSLPYSATAKYALFAVPTYVLLGCLISNAGIGEQIYRVVNKMVRRLPGGLAATAVMATSIFSGISGSSAADVATFGRISVTEMARNGYPRPYAAAVVAAAGTFAVLIPPSITLIIYAIIAQESVGAMILAALVPGVISCVALAAFVVIRALLAARTASALTPHGAAEDTRGASGSEVEGSHGVLAPAVVAVSSTTAKKSIGAGDVLALVYAAVIFLVVVGGLYSGVFTSTEAGAVGAAVALVIAFIVTRSTKTPMIGLIQRSSTEAVEISAMIFLLLVGGSMFSLALTLSGLPIDIAIWAGDLAIPPQAVLALILLLLVPLGAFLDGLSVMLLTVPIIAPIALELGFNGVWFGILVMKMVEIGLITPPVGINAFIISSITSTPVEKVYRALIPFILLDLAITAVFFMFPDLVLWLPRAAGLL